MMKMMIENRSARQVSSYFFGAIDSKANSCMARTCRERNREYHQAYTLANPQRVEKDHRQQILARARKWGRFPSVRSIQKYHLSEEELRSLAVQIYGLHAESVASQRKEEKCC